MRARLLTITAAGSPPEININAAVPLEERDVLAQAINLVEDLARAGQAQAETLRQAQMAVEAVSALKQPPAPPVVHPVVPRSVAMQARQALEQNPLFLDYETTGIRRGVQVEEIIRPDGQVEYTTTGGKKYHQVVEISVIDAGGRTVFHSLVNPLRPVPPGASQAHGLTEEQLQNAPVYSQVAPLLRQILAGRVVVAHKSEFEALFTPPQWGITWVCTKKLADQAFGKADYRLALYDWRESGSLANRLRQCGLLPTREHTAAGDALDALRLLRYLAGYHQLS